ncbi:MAG TPA: hypothetical protein VFH27_02520, partial [Longimicrobiaceae bacterium]|nr:hypothetical protein [Longimicrobiaceae bacterium]
MNRRPVHLALALATCALAACGRADAHMEAAAPARASAAAPVSPAILTIEEQLAAFRRCLTLATELAGGFRSVDALEEAFAAALSAGDTAALRRMTLDRAEFAWLYYPQNPRALPPYELDPDLMWMQLVQNGGRGMRRALREHAGAPLRIAGHGCDGPTQRYGAVTVMNGCW